MKEKILSYIGMSCLFALIFALSVIAQGIVLSFLWAWFVAPLGVSKISIIHAIGLYLLLEFVTFNYDKYAKAPKIDMMLAIEYIFINPLYVFLFGGVIYLLMRIL